MERLPVAVKAALSLFVLAVTLVGNSLPGAAREETRFVPQLELTDLRPRTISFCPDDEPLLLVVNDHGRIDLFDLSNPARPVKITEIDANASAAALIPRGTPRDNIQIVSGGFDGSVRLWTLAGKPAAGSRHATSRSLRKMKPREMCDGSPATAGSLKGPKWELLLPVCFPENADRRLVGSPCAENILISIN
jgi:WD40 repeat protein